MRGKRTILAAAVVTAVVASSQAAAANGGAYIELDQQHYLPGDRGTALAYVSVPEHKESIFDLGPFYLFALPEGMVLAEDRPIPAAAVRLATFAIQEEKHQYELSTSFTVPQLAGDFYSLGVCNDPCTVSGFRESLSGSISVIATLREAELLNENSHLSNRVYRFRSAAHRLERRLEAAREDLELQLANGQAERERLTSDIEALERRLAAAERRASDAARPSFDPWIVGAILAVVVAAGALTFRRRRLVPVVGDLP